MSLLDPQEEFEGKSVESTEELTTIDSTLVESDSQAQISEPEPVDGPVD